MTFIDFKTIVKYAWMAYDGSRPVKRIWDISAKVSTNHVYKIKLEDGNSIIAKLSYFGKFDHFVEDHTIINVLSNNLPDPFENFLARALMKENTLFVHRFKSDVIDAWIVFYRPIKIKNRLPRRLDESQIEKLAVQVAKFHKACHSIRNTLPKSSKTLKVDIDHLLEIVHSDFGKYEHRMMHHKIKAQCDEFLQNLSEIESKFKFEKIPVFVDWNIGNFSITPSFKLYSRWDYDWFRISSRMLDFYFFSRVVSDIGDRTVFSYLIDPMMEERFILFLKTYHQVFPLSETEIRFLKEVYRFFILNYVIKDGRYFFHEIFASKLQKEAYETYFPSIEKFDEEKLLNALKL